MTLLAVVALLGVSEPALPAAQQPVAPVAAPAVKPKKEKKICKREEALTGSRMAKTTCLTASEWDRRSNSGVDAADLRTMGAH